MTQRRPSRVGFGTQVSRPVVIVLVVAFGALAMCIVAAVGLTVGALVIVTSGPHDTVTRYYEAVRAENWAGAYAELAGPLTEQVTVDDLRLTFEQAAALEGRITNVSILGTSVESDTAEVNVTVDRERSSGSVTVFLVREGDGWKISGF